MTVFNKQQQAAISALESNVMVSASAGAGKTTVLIARLMKRIIEDGVRIDEICALTFTEAAASEMKERLLISLTQFEGGNSDFINEQISLVETANISTIHAFCLTIIKNHGYILGLDPLRAQNILDPSMAEILSQEALTTTITHWIKAKASDFESLADVFIRRADDLSNLKAAILETAKFLLSKPDAQRAIDDNLALYTISNLSEWPLSIRQQLCNHYKTRFTMVTDRLKDLIAYCDIAFVGTKYSELSTQYLQNYQQLHSFTKEIEPNNLSFYQNIPQFLDFKLPTVMRDAEYKNLTDSLTETIKECLQNYRDDVIETLNFQAPIIERIYEMTRNYLEEFETIKVRENGYDFNDFETLALKLLQHNNNYVSELLKNQFKEIMVDEFQDTNEYQDAIIRLLSTGDNLFRVGDVKQSIYRFRGAKPQIMQSLTSESTILNLYLNFNYRSKNDIVSFNNDLFSALMNHTYGLKYHEMDHVTVGIEPQHENSVPVELIVAVDEEKNSATYRRTQKARLIAKEVIRYHEKGYRFRDIVILVRNHSEKIFLKAAFEELNIPHFIDDRSGFYRSQTIASIMHWFNYALTGAEYHLAFVLTSPFIGYSDDQLALLRLSGSPNLKLALKDADPQTFSTIQNTIDSWSQHSITAIITNLINLNNVYHEKLSIQAKTNVDALLQKATSYQSFGIPTLSGFVHFVSEMDDDKNSEASPLNEEDDVVTAVTIHQSKGLQYPVVIVWSLGSRTVLDHKSQLLSDELLGLSLTHYAKPYHVMTKSLLRVLTESKQNDEDLEEYLRILYVALTRAQDRLVIVDFVNEVKEQPLSTYLLYNFSQSSELIRAVTSRHLKTTIVDFDESITRPLHQETKPTHVFRYAPLPLESKQKESVYTALQFNPHFIEATQYGTRLHHALETLPHRHWTHEDLEKYDGAVVETLLRYNKHAFTNELYNADTIEHEVPFVLDNDGDIVQGIIDFYAIMNNTVYLVDFKSDAVEEDILRVRYQHQLDQYKKVLNMIYPELPCIAFIYSFYNNTYINLS